MLTNEEKKVIADKMGWCLHHYASKGKLWGTGICTKCKDPLPKDHKFSLNDAGLVRDWLVERGDWDKFENTLPLLWIKDRKVLQLIAWLFATENGEATNFFRAFVKWCEEGK